MAERCPYERQLREACRLVTEQVAGKGEGGRGKGEAPAASRNGANLHWDLVFQSRSGPPSQPWLEPDIRDYLRQLAAAGAPCDVVLVPIGFLAENLEVVYDLDVEVRALCDELGINVVRAPVVGSHPRLAAMIRELIAERIDSSAPRLALGPDGPWPDQCPANCCQKKQNAFR
jgi:ferrochelatase